MKKLLFPLMFFALLTVSCEGFLDDDDVEVETEQQTDPDVETDLETGPETDIPSTDDGLKVLTFEDVDYVGDANYLGNYSWSSLIDNAQYGGLLLYGEGGSGVTTAYTWTDGATQLHNEIIDCWGLGTYEFWNGGVVVSNYYAEVVSGMSYDSQLAVPCLDSSSNGSGNAGSSNFAVVNADIYSQTALSFVDGEDRVIDHMYIANTSYALSVCEYGDYMAESLGATDSFWVTITGYTSEGLEAGSVVFYLAEDGVAIEGWNKCDLSSLGAVNKINFQINSSVQNSYGSVIPSYMAIDDIAVVFDTDTDTDVAPEIDPDPEIDTDTTSLTVLTFEDVDYVGDANYLGDYSWSSLIDDAQYGGLLLYGEGGSGVTTAYTWTDGATQLHNEIIDCWGLGTYEFWNGGVVVSNYYAEVVSGMSYDSQLAVPCLDSSSNGSGNAGSSNFAVVNADIYSQTALSFADGEDRVIDHMYIANTSYALSVCEYGDYMSDSLGATDSFWVTITGYTSEGLEAGSVVFFLAEDGVAIEGWNKCDLSSLGAVNKINFQINSSVQNSYGSVIPSYMAIDDIAVQF